MGYKSEVIQKNDEQITMDLNLLYALSGT